MKHAGFHHGAVVEIDWIQAEDVEGLLAVGRLAQLDGMVIPGGFGPWGIDGKIAAAEYARVNNIPCLGLCLGMQVMTIEFARHVLGLGEANSTEFDPTSQHPVIDLMLDQRYITDKGGTMRLGVYYAVLQPGSKVAEAYGEPVVSERHRHRYEFNSHLSSPLRSSRVGVLRHLAGQEAGGVHRAGRPSVLGRHPGPPRVQEPSGPAASAVS